MFNPTFFNATDLIKNGCPLIKRKLFCEEQHILQFLGKDNARYVIHYLHEHDLELEDAIWEDLLATRKYSLLNRSLHFLEVLPDSTVIFDEKKSHASKAMVIFAYYQDQVDYVCSYIKNLPSDVRIFVISSKEDVLIDYKNKLLNLFTVETRICPNRGRDLGALLTTGYDILDRYDILCTAKDKKSPQCAPMYSRDYSNHVFELINHIWLLY